MKNQDCEIVEDKQRREPGKNYRFTWYSSEEPIVSVRIS